MTPEEWEALCDGCGKCCLLKFEDEDEPGRVVYTNIGCRLFDDAECRCANYAMRSVLVKGCVVLNPATLDEAKGWMPKTCAYRLRAEGKPLPDWHPLVSGDPDSVHRAGMSMQRATVPEYEIDEEDWQDYVIEDVT